AYYKRVCKIKAKNEKNKSEEDVIIEQAMIDHARPLTEEEEELKKELLIQGFSNWSRRDFFSFISANAKHSRYDLKAISEEFKNDKTYEEVKEYAEKFWNNFRDIENYERYIGQIEVGEDKLRKIQLQKEALRRKVASYEYPMRDMEFKLPYTATSKKEWNDYEDRWLVIQMLRIGIENDDLFEQIFNEIQFGNSLVVEMDFWLQSRNVAEIGRRCQTLLGAIVKEAELLASAKAKAKSKAKSKANSKSVKSSKKQLKTKKTTTNTTDSTNKGRKRGRSEVENNKNKNKNKKRR
ncbi:MAG: uncharacterized protein K0Q49_2573, partial [Haloplasmataceae bacterium]|nr:uncharacterized protein [Haloplasmataceae bacterium]